MRTYKQITKKVEDKIYCDLCGSKCTHDLLGSEYALLEAYWGYCSKHDGQKYEIHLCEQCFFLTLDWMKKIRNQNLQTYVNK